MQAIWIIRDEHRALTAILHGMRYLFTRIVNLAPPPIGVGPAPSYANEVPRG